MADTTNPASPPAAAAAATNNKRPFSAEPEDSTHNKKANIQGEEDDITADDVKIEQPVASTQATEPKAEETPAPKKMEGEDSKMQGVEDVKPAGEASTSTLPPAAPSAPPAADAASQQIQMRCLIVTQDASVIIGKGGRHVNEIRERSGARVTVSESIPGNPERILHVSGPLDAVSKAFGLIVRRINDEPFDVASVPGSRAVTIKFIIPNSRMGTVIGKGGSKIKEIQEASGARLNASEAMLPGSTERVLSVSGVADAVHIATYYIGNILIEYQDRPGSHRDGSGAGRSEYRQQGSGRDSYRPGSERGDRSAQNVALAPGAQTQSIYIPNDLVGPIIGKAGSKINEIRTLSNTQIRIMEPHQQGSEGNPNERLVTITGQPDSVNTAMQLLYQRLEQEKARQLQ
ncbi:PolyC-binding proteins alphaCP-1 and related KH domain proteins [Phaffia rhodozyma]|uniref:PolyC-binding proteins alphaCP-1 and related KH domain proteins n=1 Tax=Phaffia rhodozyma TaxID=264483 RepID=A0A0F7SRG1_PHARH|nr:PolyC-binding proteins alphaCP-1 and related KH domain proteins [Phaffia rhodozyma]